MSDLVVRRIPFEFPEDLEPHWNPSKPEWSHMVNGASLVMPYLEPYLIQGIRRGLKQIDDPVLLDVAKDYCAQEGQHYRQHKRFNELLASKGYPELRGHEEEMERTYARFLERRSLRFHLAYAAGHSGPSLAHKGVGNGELAFSGAPAEILGNRET